jgi:hypothetical protein
MENRTEFNEAQVQTWEDQDRQSTRETQLGVGLLKRGGRAINQVNKGRRLMQQ